MEPRKVSLWIRSGWKNVLGRMMIPTNLRAPKIKCCKHSYNALVLQGMLNEAYTLFSEAFSILQQVSFFTFCLLSTAFFLLSTCPPFPRVFPTWSYDEFCRLLVPCIEKLPTVAGNLCTLSCRKEKRKEKRRRNFCSFKISSQYILHLFFCYIEDSNSCTYAYPCLKPVELQPGTSI